MGPKDGPASPPGRRGPRIPRRSARLASALLVVLAALCGVGAIFRGIELNLIGDASYEQAAASDRRLFILALVHLGVGAVTSVVFLTWFNRVYRNLGHLGANPRHHPLWAVGAWIVPVVNLVMPPGLVADTWRGSVPASSSRPGTPARVPIVAGWWTLLVGGGVARWLATVIHATATAEAAFESGTVLHIGALLAQGVAALLGARLVIAITRGQLARLAAPADPTPAPASALVGPAPPVPSPADPPEASPGPSSPTRRPTAPIAAGPGIPARVEAPEPPGPPASAPPGRARRRSVGRFLTRIVVVVATGLGGAIVVAAALANEPGQLRLGAAILAVPVLAAIVAAFRPPASRRGPTRVAAALTVTLVAASVAAAARQIDECEKRGARVDLSGCDLAGADLAGADLAGADLFDADLTGADLRGAHLAQADLTDADLSGADLRRANLRDTQMSRASLTGTDLSEADLTNAQIAGGTAQSARFDDATMVNTGLAGTDLDQASLAGANLTTADLAGASLDHADLTAALLTGVLADQATLTNARLVDAQLVATSLVAANLRAADLSGAKLERMNLSRADLAGASLAGVSMVGVNLEQTSLLNVAGLADETLAAGVGTSTDELSRALLKRSTLLEPTGTVTRALAGVCDGRAAEGARPYAPEPRLHPAVVDDIALEHEATRRLWAPAALRFAELVVCPGPRGSESVELCGPYRIFSSGEVVTLSRLRTYWSVTIRAAATAEVVAERRFLGGSPRSCEDIESFSSAEVARRAGGLEGPPVDTAQVVAWVAGIVDPAGA